MTTQEMQHQFNELSRRLDSLETTNSAILRDIERNKMRSANDRLVREYQRISCIGFVMAFSSFIMTHDIIDLWLRLIISIYFLICGFMDLYLYLGIKRIDCYSMGVMEVASKALFYRKRHHQFIAILVPLVVCILTCMAWQWSSDAYMLYGMIAGAVFGIILGLRLYLSFMKQYRSLSESLR